MEKTIYLNSGKCAWGRCIFCGWGKHEYRKKSIHELKKLIDEKINEKVDVLKIFNSGSFLDTNQIPRAIRKYVVKKCDDLGIKNLVIESRGDFFDDEFVEDMKSDSVHVTIGFGLEAADNEALKKLKKGLTVEKYIEYAEFLKEHGFGLRSYILVNAPYTDKKILKKSVELALLHSESLCLINWFPHGKSEAFDLWIQGKWKPLNEKEFDKWTDEFDNPKVEKYFEEFVFVPRWPMHKQELIRGATEKELVHPYYEVWQDYITYFYHPPKKKEILFFVPCSFRKPYFASKLHKAIATVVKDPKIHWVAISSPGVIPYEFADRYPFNRYDWPEWEETPEIKKLYIKVNQKRIENFLLAHAGHYKKVYSYFKPSSESFIALEKACKKLGIKFVNCLSDETYERVKDQKNPLSLPESLENLKKCIGPLWKHV